MIFEKRHFAFFFVFWFFVCFFFFFCRLLFPLVLCNIHSRSFSAIFSSFLCSFLFPFVGQWTQRNDVLGQTVGDLTNDRSSPCYRQLSPLGTLHFRVRPSIRSLNLSCQTLGNFTIVSLSPKSLHASLSPKINTTKSQSMTMVLNLAMNQVQMSA